MRAPWDIWKFPLLVPDAPASLSGLPSEPAFAVPAVLPPPPVYGSSVASGKLEEDVAAMGASSSRHGPQATRSGKPVADGSCNWNDAGEPCEAMGMWRRDLKRR
jgi:hypothetical protein